jgi:hypothetical protein|tara:strand:+ start:24589 stop:24690 length:102 start_codon:yes stop_codon:yes gene_type:complete
MHRTLPNRTDIETTFEHGKNQLKGETDLYRDQP